MGMNNDDRTVLIVRYFEQAHDGPGWYWSYEDLPEEGLCGAFSTEARCRRHAEGAPVARVEVVRQ